jgi:hypothetical protein
MKVVLKERNVYDAVKWDGKNTQEVFEFVSGHGSIVEVSGILQISLSIGGVVELQKSEVLIRLVDGDMFNLTPKEFEDKYEILEVK